MTADFSYLEVTQRRNALGKIEQFDVFWKGDSPYVRLGWDFMRFPEIVKIDGEKEIQIGPYRLLKVDDGFDFCVTYVRKDKFGALRVALYKLTRTLDLIYRRTIITLAVWGLADFHQAYVPSWRDIRIVKRFLKK